MTQIENGLPVGLKFYDDLYKQKRFTYECYKGVRHKEYQYTDNCTLPPFQIRRSTDPSTTKELEIICVDTGEVFDLMALYPSIVDNIGIFSIGAYDYILYYGNHDCMNLDIDQKILVYAHFSDGDNDWYSELFWMDPNLTSVEDYYREWTPGQIRKVDSSDLRIWRT